MKHTKATCKCATFRLSPRAHKMHNENIATTSNPYNYNRIWIHLSCDLYNINNIIFKCICPLTVNGNRWSKAFSYDQYESRCVNNMYIIYYISCSIKILDYNSY